MNKETKKIPVYELYLDGSDQDGVYGIAVTKSPAIERSFIALSQDKKQKQKIKYSANKKEQILTGALLIPEQLIYREDDLGNPYYVKISASEIKKAAQKYAKDGNNLFFNIEHDKSIQGLYTFESWVVGAGQDKVYDLCEYFTKEDIPAGSWIVSAKVENDTIWEQIEKGDFVGFSMEGLFSSLKVDMNATLERLNKLSEALNSDMNELDKLRLIESFICA